MSLSRKRRRKEERRRHHESRLEDRPSPGDGFGDGAGAWPSPEQLFAAKSALEESRDSELEATSASLPDVVDEASRGELASRGLQEAEDVHRLAYTRRQAAEALGVSISTIDRHVVPLVETVKLPWGQRLILAEGIERLLNDYREHARGRPARRPAGRPQTLPRGIVERIRLEYARGRGLSEIARALTAEGVPTAHGGQRWWPSTVRAVLVRSSPSPEGLQAGAWLSR
jgi:hypothetical protein